jgi:hypothetical protein
MRAMWLGFSAAIVIAAIAAAATIYLGDSAEQRFATSSTRL